MTFVPDDFVVPTGVKDEEWHLEAITIHHALRDFECYLENREHLETRMKDVEPDWEWPPSLTLEDDVAEMGWHQGEFRRRTSFAYMLLTDEGRRSIGCVYLFPEDEPYDARLDFWVTADAFESGLDSKLADFLRGWLRDVWPFEQVRWPHRHR